MKATLYTITNHITQDEVEVGKLQEEYDISVTLGDEMVLPSAFATPFRNDLIKRAVATARANRRQPYGSRKHEGKKNPMPGMRHSVEWWGKGRGVSRIMRIAGSRRGAQNPHTVGGRRAHGPKVEKDWSQSINTKERKMAVASALAATGSLEMVKERGHKFDSDIEQLPIILDGYIEERGDVMEEFSSEVFSREYPTRKLVAILQALGLGDDLKRAKDGRGIRAGRGKMRGRKRKTPKSILLVVRELSGLALGARNLPGVDVVEADRLSTEDLAPGGLAGRLTIFTKESINELRRDD